MRDLGPGRVAQWVSRLAPLEPHALAYDKPLCASLDGFTLHAATRAGALDPAGRMEQSPPQVPAARARSGGPKVQDGRPRQCALTAELNPAQAESFSSSQTLMSDW